MQERLSQDSSIVALYDQGFSLPWTRDEAHNSNDSLLPRVDLKSLLKKDDAEELVQALPPQVLYFSMKEQGIEACLEVLPMLTQEQFSRILDYDVWQGGTLVPQKVLRWLKLYSEAGHEEVYKRFSALEEELQIATLEKYIKVYDKEETERMPPEMQDSLYRLPGDEFFYAIDSGEGEIHEGIAALFETIMSQNMSYAFSLLAHAAYMPPNESEFTLGQFRKARLEEDGFVTYDEALSLFAHFDKSGIEAKWEIFPGAQLSVTRSLAVSSPQKPSLLKRLLARGHSELEYKSAELLYLANGICAATRFETDDISALKNALEISHNFVNLGLEILSAGDEEKALRILASEHCKTLFRYGLSLFENLRAEVVDAVSRLQIAGAANFHKHWREQKLGKCMLWIEEHLLAFLGLQHSESLKALFNRFPLYAYQEQDGLHVRFSPVADHMSFVKLTENIGQICALLLKNVII